MGIEPTSKAWEAYDITQKHAGLAAFLQFPERLNWKIMENGKRPLLARLLDPDPRIEGILSFTPDGKGLVYPIDENGVSNLWVQPLDGSGGHQITHFRSGRIGDFHWSPDGSKLAVQHEEESADVVLLHDLTH